MEVFLRSVTDRHPDIGRTLGFLLVAGPLKKNNFYAAKSINSLNYICENNIYLYSSAVTVISVVTSGFGTDSPKINGSNWIRIPSPLCFYRHSIRYDSWSRPCYEGI